MNRYSFREYCRRTDLDTHIDSDLDYDHLLNFCDMLEELEPYSNSTVTVPYGRNGSRILNDRRFHDYIRRVVAYYFWKCVFIPKSRIIIGDSTCVHLRYLMNEFIRNGEASTFEAYPMVQKVTSNRVEFYNGSVIILETFATICRGCTRGFNFSDVLIIHPPLLPSIFRTTVEQQEYFRALEDLRPLRANVINARLTL